MAKVEPTGRSVPDDIASEARAELELQLINHYLPTLEREMKTPPKRGKGAVWLETAHGEGDPSPQEGSGPGIRSSALASRFNL